MNPSPCWIGGKLCCMYFDESGTCGREMFIRDDYAMCEVASHGGLFPVPPKPERVRFPKSDPPLTAILRED